MTSFFSFRVMIITMRLMTMTERAGLSQPLRPAEERWKYTPIFPVTNLQKLHKPGQAIDLFPNLAHAKPLKDRTQSLKYTVTCQVEKDMDLNKFPHRRTITFAARLAGYGPIVSALREHKHFGITVAEDVVFQNGKMTNSKARMVEMKQKLTDKQIASFLKHDWMLSTNMYDKFYKMVRDKAKDLQKMRKKKRDDVDFRYIGSYTSGKRTFYIVKLDNVRVHIADGCWQISRMSYHEGQNDMQYEFKEVKPDLFLLSHGKAKLYIDKEKWPQGFVSLKLDYDYK